MKRAALGLAPKGLWAGLSRESRLAPATQEPQEEGSESRVVGGPGGFLSPRAPG